MISSHTNMVIIVMDIFCGSYQEEVFFKQLEEFSWSQVLVFMDDFNHSGIWWKDNEEGHKQSRRLFECIEDYTKAGGVVDTLEGCSIIQRDLGRLEREAEGTS